MNDIQRRSPKAKRRIQLQILQGLPGIGPGRAQSLLEKYGSVQNVMQADYADLLDTSNIGEDRAKRIRWAVSERIADYDATYEPESLFPDL